MASASPPPHATADSNKQQRKADIPYVDDDDEVFTRPVRHTFEVLTARSAPGDRTVKITMPSPDYKMVAASVTSVGNTIVLGSYPESLTTWSAVHDPARENAYVVLKVLALVDEEDIYETTVKRLQMAHVAANDPSCAWGDANPKHLLEMRLGAKACTLTCPVPSKYTLCGGGFYSPMPIISSLPVGKEAYGKALMTRREQEAFGGGGWAVAAPSDDRLVVFAVGLRVRRTAGVSTNISVCLDGGVWTARLPRPHNEVVVYLGGSDTQDPAAAALFLAPSEASKVAISKAPPTVWAQYRTPYKSIEDREREKQFTKLTTVA